MRRVKWRSPAAATQPLAVRTAIRHAAIVKNRPQTFHEMLQSCLLHPPIIPIEGPWKTVASNGLSGPGRAFSSLRPCGRGRHFASQSLSDK
jgi:hypothetical protein